MLCVFLSQLAHHSSNQLLLQLVNYKEKLFNKRHQQHQTKHFTIHSTP